MAISDLSNLIAHWRLDGDGDDAHGSNDLTENNTPSYSEAGVVRENGAFNQFVSLAAASSEHFSIADNSDLSTGDVDFTIAAWVRIRSNGNEAIVSKEESAGTREWGLFRSSSASDELRFQIYDSGGSNVGTAETDTPGALRTDVWYLVIAWHDADGNTVNVQVGDERELFSADSSATSGVPSDTSSDFYIGRFQSIYGNVDIQSVSFWKGRTLTSDERTALWNDGFGLDYPFDGSPLRSGETAIAPDGQDDADGHPNQGGFRDFAIASVDISGTRYQATAFWDHRGGNLCIGTRTLPSGEWSIERYDGSHPSASIQGTDDSHNVPNIGLDPNGYLHIAYDMHNGSLKYRRSDAALNSWTGGLTTTLSMLGTNETSVSYPTFFNDPAGTLYFMFRDGNASSGDIYFYEYDESGTSWSAATGTGTNGILIDGSSDGDTVYIDAPIFDENFGSGGYLHLSFMYRDEGVEGWDYNYVYWDGTDWYQADGSSQTVPIAQSNDDPFDTATTLFNQNSIDVDSNGQPHIAYWKYDGATGDQLYHATYDGSWTITQLTSGAGRDVFGTDTAGRPRVIIDRDTDSVYIVYRDDADGSYPSQLLLYQSDAGDFGSWTQVVVYAADVGAYEPTYDRNYWESDGELNFFLAPYWGLEAQKPIDVFDYNLPAAIMGAGGVPRPGAALASDVFMI